MKKAPESHVSIVTKAAPSQQTLRGLDWLNFLLADIQTGVGPFRAAVALTAFAILYLLMPETHNKRLEIA
jgi:hypothetical protein